VWLDGLWRLFYPRGGFGIANIMFVSVRERTNFYWYPEVSWSEELFYFYSISFEAVFESHGGIAGIVLGVLPEFCAP